MSAPTDERLVALARERQDDLVSATQALVALDTQTPPSDTRAAARLAASMLQDVPGVEVTLHESESPVLNLVARLPGGMSGPRLVLSGHLDTYPIGSGTWTHDPLGGEVANGRLYGRGSADMKGACAALIETVRIYATHMRPFPGELVLALAGDEERMGELGTQWLIDHVPEVAGDGVIVADVGGPHTVRLGEKGMIWLDIVAEGRQAHGAHVHSGENAADRLIDALLDLRGLEDLPVALPPEAARVIAAAASISGADGEAARHTMQRVTVNLGRIQGGASSNLVPGRAEAGVDIRFPPGISAKALEDEIARRLSRRTGLSWTVTRSYEASWTPESAPVARACLEAAERVMEVPVFADMRIGGSDARLWRRAGFETVVNGLTANNLGAPDENLLVDELWRVLAITCIAGRNFLFATQADPSV